MEAIGLPPLRIERSEGVSLFWANQANLVNRRQLPGTQAPDT